MRAIEVDVRRRSGGAGKMGIRWSTRMAGLTRVRCPLRPHRRVQQASDVQTLGRHEPLIADGAPGRARPICVDLDSKTVRIPQVKRLTHRMIRRRDSYAELRKMCDEPPEPCAVGQQQGEMV